MKFNWHEKGNHSTYLVPSVTILKTTSVINFNVKCFREYLINKDGSKKYSYILLGYDEELNIIGFKLLTEEQKGSYPIRKIKRDSYVTVSASYFLKCFNLKHDVTQNYEVTWHEDEEMLTIQLDEKYRKE